MSKFDELIKKFGDHPITEPCKFKDLPFIEDIRHVLVRYDAVYAEGLIAGVETPDHQPGQFWPMVSIQAEMVKGFPLPDGEISRCAIPVPFAFARPGNRIQIIVRLVP